MDREIPFMSCATYTRIVFRFKLRAINSVPCFEAEIRIELKISVLDLSQPFVHGQYSDCLKLSWLGNLATKVSLTLNWVSIRKRGPVGPFTVCFLFLLFIFERDPPGTPRDILQLPG